MNKKFLTGTALILIATTLSGCSVHFDKDGIRIGSESKSEEVKSAKKAPKKQSSSSSAKAKSAQSSSKTEKSASKSSSSKKKTTKKNKSVKKQKKTKKTAQKALWNKKKDKKLEKFIGTWSETVSQIYEKYDGKHSLENLAGTTYPAVFKQRQFSLNDKNVTLDWSNNGRGKADYNVVAIYNDDFKDKNWHLTYLFCIHNKKPVVLLDQGKNVNPMILTKAQDKNLQNGFARIVKQ